MANTRHFTFLPGVPTQAFARLLTAIDRRCNGHRLALDIAVRRKRA